MSRISLPGKEKHKKVILLILVLISAGILIYEFSNNMKNKNKYTDISSSEPEYLSGVYEFEENSNEYILEDKDTSNKNSDNISERERELYNSVYTIFFSGDYEEAIRKGDELIKEFPDSYMGYNIRGIAKAYNGDFDGAMSDIDLIRLLHMNYTVNLMMPLHGIIKHLK